MEYETFEFKRKPALIVKLFINEPRIEFEPEFKQTERMIRNCFSHILRFSEDVSRVEAELFPPNVEIQVQYLKTIRAEEVLYDNFVKRAVDVFEANKIGPHKYLDSYKKYADFMNNKADQEISNFLRKTDNQLDDFEAQIKKYSNIKREITLLLVSVPLNLYSLECNGLHESLRDRVQKLKDRLVQFCIDHNRETNKQLDIFKKKIFY